MSTMRFAIERFSVTSSKPFEAVVAALRAAVGRLDVVEFAKASKEARTFSELENLIHRHEGRTGLMLFMELDLGVILRKETGLHQPKIVRFLIGNPPLPLQSWWMSGQMAFICRMTRWRAFWLPMRTRAHSPLLGDLDSKIESLLRESAA